MFTGSIRSTIDAARVCGCPACRHRTSVLTEAALSKLSFDLTGVPATFLPIVPAGNS
jgi:hypothetical protein